MTVSLQPLSVDTERLAVDIAAAAFDVDPLWAWVMPAGPTGAAARRELWRIVVEGAMVHELSWVDDAGRALIAWIPPGGAEWGASGEASLARLERSLPAPHGARLREVLARLAAVHPEQDGEGRPLAYLSLLAVAPTAQRAGLGARLLRATLERVEERGWSSYLEASSPLAVPFYEREGFVVRERLELGAPALVTTMLRERSRA